MRLKIATPSIEREITLRLLQTVATFGLVGALVALCTDGLGFNLLGFGNMDVARNAVAVTAFGSLIALFVPRYRSVRLGLILTIPLLTQFYQVGLAWDFALGPTSLIRVLPYVGVAMAVVAELIRRPISLSRAEQMGWLASAGIGILGWASGLGTGLTGPFGFIVFGLLLPGMYAFLKQQFENEPTAKAQIGAAGFVSFLALAVGTFVVIRLGSAMDMGGVAGLLGTRNVSDYNLIFAYMLLLWPLALMASGWFGPWCVGMISSLFLASAVIGLSRTGILMVPLLIIGGLVALYGKQPRQLGLTIAAVVVSGAAAWSMMPNRETLGTVWGQRFNIGSVDQMLEVANRVRPGGDDSEARDQLRNEALRLWRQDPLIGQGYGGFGAFSVRGFNDAHSITFTTLAENGLIGLVALYGLFGFLALRLLRLARWDVSGPKSLFLLSFAVWLMAIHSVGGNLAVISAHGFNVNAINGLLIVLYLWVHRLFIPAPQPQMVSA